MDNMELLRSLNQTLYELQEQNPKPRYQSRHKHIIAESDSLIITDAQLQKAIALVEEVEIM